MGVERAPEVVHHPLADARSEIFLRVGADCTHYRDRQRGDGGEFQYRQPVRADERHNLVVDPTVRVGLAGLQNIVEDNLYGPGLQQVGGAFANHGKHAHRQRLRMWS